MATSHTVHCCADDCDEYSVRVEFADGPVEEVARRHRSELATDGWQDIEGRDYCPAEEV
jgi:hypothetical protein